MDSRSLLQSTTTAIAQMPPTPTGNATTGVNPISHRTPPTTTPTPSNADHPATFNSTIANPPRRGRPESRQRARSNSTPSGSWPSHMGSLSTRPRTHGHDMGMCPTVGYPDFDAGGVCLPPSPVGNRPRDVGCRIRRGTDQSAHVDHQLPAYPRGDARPGARRGHGRIVRRHSHWNAARRLRSGVVRAREDCGWCSSGICRRRDRYKRESRAAHYEPRERRNIRSDLLGVTTGDVVPGGMV